MSYTPVPEYEITKDFSEDEANSVAGRSEVLTASLDTEFVNIKATLDALRANLDILQRSDGGLEDLIVKPHTFDSAALALIASTITPRGAWATATNYVVGDFVSTGGAGYLCAEAHTSGTFSTDLAAEKWNIVSNVDTTYSGFSFDSDTTKDKLVSNSAMNLLENFRNLLTTQGDILIRDGGANARLAKGAAATVMRMSSTIPSWQEQMPRETKTASFTITRADGGKIFDVDTSAGSVTVTMPDVNAGDVGDGWRVWIRVLDDSNTVILQRAGSTDLFEANGQTTITLNIKGECVSPFADTVNDVWKFAEDNRFVGASMGRNSAQSIPQQIFTPIVCNISNIDYEGLVNTTTGRITVKEKGLYFARIQAQSSGVIADGIRCILTLYKNGSAPTITSQIQEGIYVGSGSSTPQLNASGIIELDASDYVQVVVDHESTTGNVDWGVGTVCEIFKIR